MPTHTETRTMPFSADQMYALVADVGSYPEFLPWCSAARIRARNAVAGGGNVEMMEADLVVSFKVFRERFGSRVRLDPDARRIDTEYIDGPFKYLKSWWKFAPRPDGHCEVRFFVDFEFRNPVLQKLIGVVFNEAMQRIVRAYETRAKALYAAS